MRWRNLEKLKSIPYVQFDMSTKPISMKCTKFIRIKTYFSLYSYTFIKSIHFSYISLYFLIFSFVFDIFSFNFQWKNSFIDKHIVSVAFSLVRIFSINLQWKFRHDNFASLYLNREKTNQHWNSVEFFLHFIFLVLLS